MSFLSEIAPPQRTRANLHKQLVASSGKMVLLDKLLPRLMAQGHKARASEEGVAGCARRIEHGARSRRSARRSFFVERVRASNVRLDYPFRPALSLVFKS